MHKVLKHTTIILIVLSLLAVPISGFAAESLNKKKETSAGAMAADTIVIRPFGALATIAGFGLFVISSPFSAMGGNIDKAFDSMVKKPAEFTFARPLGDL